jgi:hypothetical protein
MTPVAYQGHNVVIAKDQKEYFPIPAHVSRAGVVTICWKLTEDEMEQILVTGMFWHQIHTFNTPMNPVHLSAVKPTLDES